MSVYLTYEINEGELRYEGDSVVDTRFFDNLDYAINDVADRIKQGIEEYDFIPDINNEKVYGVCKKLHPDHIELVKAIKEELNNGKYFSINMFNDHQDNWDCYYTIIFEEKEVQ